MEHWKFENEMLEIIVGMVDSCIEILEPTIENKGVSKNRRQLYIKLLAIKCNIQSTQQQIIDDHKPNAPLPEQTVKGDDSRADVIGEAKPEGE